jgi:hypothetical protein
MGNNTAMVAGANKTAHHRIGMPSHSAMGSNVIVAKPSIVTGIPMMLPWLISG